MNFNTYRMDDAPEESPDDPVPDPTIQYKELFKAVQEGNIDKVKEMVNKVDEPEQKPKRKRNIRNSKKSVNGKNKGNTPKSEPINPNIRDTDAPYEPTPLLMACEAQNVEMVQVLITAQPIRADVNIADTKGKKPIW